MSSSDPNTTKPAVSRTVPENEPAQANAAADLQAALQRIADHILDADRRHSRSLEAVQERLGQVGRQVDQMRGAAGEPQAGTFDRLEQEIATLSQRISAFGEERRLQREAGGGSYAGAAADEPWDAQTAETWTQACEMAQAELAAGSRPAGAPEVAGSTQASRAAPGVPTQGQGPAIDKAWLEARLAGIAVVLQQSLAENNPTKPIAALGQRLDALETRLESMLGSVSARLGSDWINLVEDHIRELSAHFEATSRQLARLDVIDGQLQHLSRTLDEQRKAAAGQPSGLREEAVEAMIQTAAERVASRIAATQPASAAESGGRIDALAGMMQDYIDERRRGEEATSGMLQTIEEALIRIIDRIEAMEVPAPGTHGVAAAETSGVDLESERLAEAYATGVRVLGQTPVEPMLDASDYASPRARREEPAAAFGAPDIVGPGELPGSEVQQARQELRASAMRAKLKAQTAPEDDLAASHVPPLEAGTPIAAGKPRQTGGSFRSRVLIGGAMAMLFTASYLTVDRALMPGAPAAVEPPSAASELEGGRRAGAPASASPSSGSPLAGPQAGKAETVAPATDSDAQPVPVPRPAERKAPVPAGDTNQVEQGTGQNPAGRRVAGMPVSEPVLQPASAAEPAALTPQDPAAALPQSSEGGAPVGTEALPAGIGSAALREAAVKGDVYAQLEVASRFAEGKGVPQDQKLALAWYERAAMRGLASAQFRLGAYYERGIGVAADTERAKVWYRRAADQGHVRAMHNLGVIVVGSGQEQADYAGAVRWFKEAANRGYVDSQFNLATLYAAGRGVPKDLVESYMWFALAARAGDAGAQSRLEEIKAQLDQAEQDVAERKLVAWRPVGANAPAAGLPGR